MGGWKTGLLLITKNRDESKRMEFHMKKYHVVCVCVLHLYLVLNE